MSDSNDRITTALRDLADQAVPPRIRVDDAWRVGRRRHRTATLTAAIAVAAALTAALVTGLRGPGIGYSPAAYVLDRAARAAAQSGQPVPRPGQYLLVNTVGKSMTEDNPGARNARAWLTVERFRIWWPVAYNHAGMEWYDAVRYERVPWGGAPPSTGLGAHWLRVCPDTPPGRFTYEFLSKLPTAPASLRAWIYAHKNGGQSADDQAWTDITDLLESTLTPPKLTAALLRVAATIPGATVVRNVRDAAGRTGIAVVRQVQSSTESAALIFDARNYQVLGGRTTLIVREHGVGPAGTVIGAWALLSKAVVSHLPHPRGQYGPPYRC